MQTYGNSKVNKCMGGDRWNKCWHHEARRSVNIQFCFAFRQLNVNVFVIGDARKKYGGSVTLIGIATWGVVHRHRDLVVENETYNYGYLSRKPVQYDPRKEDLRKERLPPLDPNHSHFILVEGPGTGFGQEIELRTMFEACARRRKGNLTELAVTKMLKVNKLGWVGGQVRLDFSNENALLSDAAPPCG